MNWARQFFSLMPDLPQGNLGCYQNRGEKMDGDQTREVHISLAGHVATLEIDRPPNNHTTPEMIAGLADALEEFDRNPACRAIVLAARGKHFCAGADLSSRPQGAGVPRHAGSGQTLYEEAARLMRTRKPIIAAVHGAAIGAGLGLAVIADFRVTCKEARWSANFARMGFHPGFGLSATLPALIGRQKAALMMYTGRRLDGEEALAIGLADVLVPQPEVRAAAHALAEEIAASAPLAVMSIRQTLRRDLPNLFAAATEREFTEQASHRLSADYAEGVLAMKERRTPRFTGA